MSRHRVCHLVRHTRKQGEDKRGYEEEVVARFAVDIY